jgi:hypothetical protein
MRLVSGWYQRAWSMAAPNKWTRERVAIRKPHIDRANALVTSGAFEGRGHEWADTTFPGLILRVGRQGGAWHLKTESRTVRLGDMSMSVSAAREAAKRSKADLKAGKNPSRDNLRVWEDVTKSGVPVRTARAVAFPKTLHEPTEAERRRDGPWEWHDLVDVYLAKKLPTLKERWSRQYERHLRRAVDDHLRRKLVRDVTQEDLLKLRARILKARPASAAADTVEAIKAAMDWAKAQEPILSGLDSAAYPWWREGVQVEYQSGTRDHTPTLDELARTLVIAEHVPVPRQGPAASRDGFGHDRPIRPVEGQGQGRSGGRPHSPARGRLDGALRHPALDPPRRPSHPVFPARHGAARRLRVGHPRAHQGQGERGRRRRTRAPRRHHATPLHT